MPAAETVADLFYGRLFGLNPELRALFHEDMEAQGKKLMATLSLFTFYLDEPEQSLPTFRALGRRHFHYGVQPEDYQQVGEALRWALEQHLGNSFTGEVEEAWAAVYCLIAEVMQDAVADVAPRSGL